jgi:serine/threonine-protein kinase
MDPERSVEHSDCLGESVVSDYLRSRLSAETVMGVEHHLDDCAHCRELVMSLRGQEAVDGMAATSPSRVDGVMTVLMQMAVRPPADNRSGTVIAGKYRLVQRLGAGGMGVVYSAVNTWTERRVAIKIIHPWYSAEAEIVRRFHLEARSASRIAHPNIVDVLDLGQDPADGTLYMVQELLEGETLRQRLDARSRLPLDEAIALLRPVMEALAAAHEAGVVHRDVKPENVIIASDRDGRPLPKLIDFGISKIDADQWARSTTGRAMGTPLYMSPEQLRAQAIDGRSDIWAIGVVLFELLSGQQPFQGASHAELGMHIISGRPQALRTLVPDVSPAVEQVIGRALQRDREQRFATMRDFLAALVACGASSPAAARRPGARSRPIYVAAALLFAAVALVAGPARWKRASGGAAAAGPAPPVVRTALVNTNAAVAATPPSNGSAATTGVNPLVATPMPSVGAPAAGMPSEPGAAASPSLGARTAEPADAPRAAAASVRSGPVTHHTEAHRTRGGAHGAPLPSGVGARTNPWAPMLDP